MDEEARRYSSKSFNSGFILAYYHYSKEFLGYAIAVSYFIEPYLINHPGFRLGVVAKVGLTYNSNPHNDLTNNQNYSYSLYINPYLCLGLNSTLKLSKRYSLTAGMMFNHTSNGSVYHPNYGMNFPTSSLGIEYDLNQLKTKKITPNQKFDWRLDMIAFASYKTIPVDNKKFYWVYGSAFQVNRKIGFFHTVNLGIEWISDLGVKKTLEINSRPGLDFNRFGVFAGHEYLFKKFNFSQQLGIYVYNQNPYIDRLYHRWGLNYKLSSYWMAGINLEAHRQIADFLDVRLVYSVYH